MSSAMPRLQVAGETTTGTCNVTGRPTFSTVLLGNMDVVQPYYGRLTSCAPVDAAVTCGSTAACAALDRPHVIGAAASTTCVRRGVRKGSRKSARKSAVERPDRCIYRPEGGWPALLCDAVNQWPEFRFGELETWEDACYASQSTFLRLDAKAESVYDLVKS